MQFNVKKSSFFGLLVVLFLSITGVYGQDTKDVNARSPVPKEAGAKQQKKAEKKKEDQRKLKEKAIDKGRKRHEKLQSKEVRKRMKKSKKKAAANHAHKKEFFLKRWFTPGQKTKRR